MFKLLKREFSRNRTAFIVYCVIAVLSAWLYIVLFPSIQKQSAQLNEIMKGLIKQDLILSRNFFRLSL